MQYIIDAGVENIHIAVLNRESGKDDIVRNIVSAADDRIQTVLNRSGFFMEKDDRLFCEGDLYITGKLADIVKNAFGTGTVIMPAAALWAGAKRIMNSSENRKLNSLGIVDASASGYMAICIDSKGEIINDNLAINPHCGAGSGINLNRILEKLDINRDSVDKILSGYIGKSGREKRQAVTVRSDRCGVFSSSATISDKNQGIPLDYALAITMKSEVLKACRKLVHADAVFLTGRIFAWQYARDCATDYFHGLGTADVMYDSGQTLLIYGVKHLVDTIGKDNLKNQSSVKIRKASKLAEFPSFSELKEQYEHDFLYTRLTESSIPAFDPEMLRHVPVNIGLDVGSTMAKMAIADAESDTILFVNSYNNHGDTIETIKHMFSDLESRGAGQLKIQNIGITGSGRYQVQRSLQAVYPGLSNRVFTLVENYAHAHGSIDYAVNHIAKLKAMGAAVNEDFCVLVDIGGEDTKISIVALSKKELFDNAMNIKCSAGTGSLMDTLKALFNISDIGEACSRAYGSPRAYAINATCAVFLMENARKMQAGGYSKEEILASCNYAIVENMARTLWNQIEFPQNAIVLLHGQTMLSDPLPIAVTKRVQEYTGRATYCLVPPLPGHRACIGLIRGMNKDNGIIDEYYDLNDFISRTYEKKIVVCHGAACGDRDASCARASLTSNGPSGVIKLTLGGCTAVNEMQSRKAGIERSLAPDAYRELWSFIAQKLPRSDSDDRLVIPRSFAVSEQAYFLGRIFERLGFPVHCDDILEEDIFNAQPLFAIDTCAPNIGAAGQYMRLAGGRHGCILVPQIDYLPADGSSLGRTCTTNQGGVLIAMHFAKMKYPDANFVFFNISLKNPDPVNVADQLYRELKSVFQFYNRSVSRDDFISAVKEAHTDNLLLLEDLSEKTAGYLETAIENRINVSIVCAREYIMNPGIYDSHIGKLMRDKGVIALPSYAFEAGLDKNYGYMYWKNPHDILTKIDAIANKRLNEIVVRPRLKDLIRKIEHGLTGTLLSVVQVSTFRCGPDSVAVPVTTEITKQKPSLFIQSDAMIKELAHLENRVNTHLNQLAKQLHKEMSGTPAGNFSIELLNEFVFDGINKETDVVYFPTLSDNRVVTSVFRAAGITTIDNYDDDSYDLSEKVKTGRKYAGDTVCLPLSAVYADMISAIRDFIEKKKNNDPVVAGKSRILVFMNGGDGPCRLGQYVDVLKLLLFKNIKQITGSGSEKLNPDYPVKILINLTSSLSTENPAYYIEEWVGIIGFEAVILQAVMHTLFMESAVLCKDSEEYGRLYADFLRLKHEIYYILENKTRPGKAAIRVVKYIEKNTPKLGGPAKYFGYKLYRSSGLRGPLKRFSKKWLKKERKNPDTFRVYVDGEVYVRVAQIEELFKILIDEFGFRSFNIDHTPVWAFLEYIVENRILVKKDEIRKKEDALRFAVTEKQKLTLTGEIENLKKDIHDSKSTVSNLRNIFAGPLYKAAGLNMPHSMEHILHEAEPVLPSLKPHGELAPYVGEAIIQLRSGTDIFINAAPEGCMVSSMGEILTPKILETAGNPGGRIQHLFSTDGEINEELLFMAFLKKLGPERYYRK
jgi:activator of 2-hydroxyglutaryl-CoA dehydratase/predicted nucleotide-binding protein (sugar kinase/HSP70/actin superfamily)